MDGPNQYFVAVLAICPKTNARVCTPESVHLLEMSRLCPRRRNRIFFFEELRTASVPSGGGVCNRGTELAPGFSLFRRTFCLRS